MGLKLAVLNTALLTGFFEVHHRGLLLDQVPHGCREGPLHLSLALDRALKVGLVIFSFMITLVVLWWPESKMLCERVKLQIVRIVYDFIAKSLHSIEECFVRFGIGT